MMLTKLKIMAGLIGVLGMTAIAVGQLPSPTETAKATQPHEKAMPMPSSTSSKPVAIKVENDNGLGFIKSKQDPMGYSKVFLKSLEAMAEHFEYISHANRYDGRIEGWSCQPINREGLLSINPRDDGFSIAIRINKIIADGTGTVRDTELERLILKELNAQQVQKKSP